MLYTPPEERSTKERTSGQGIQTYRVESLNPDYARKRCLGLGWKMPVVILALYAISLLPANIALNKAIKPLANYFRTVALSGGNVVDDGNGEYSLDYGGELDTILKERDVFLKRVGASSLGGGDWRVDSWNEGTDRNVITTTLTANPFLNYGKLGREAEELKHNLENRAQTP